MPALATYLPTLFGIAILVAISIAVLWAYGAPHRFAPAFAILRGTIQLAILSSFSAASSRIRGGSPWPSS